MWDVLKIYVPITLLVVAGFIFTWQFVDPAPPEEITIATGDPNGAYTAFAERYQELLAAKGLRLKIRHTAGAAENIRLLANTGSGVDVALVQGGVGDPDAEPGLVSLGSVFLEPVWVLVRGQDVPDRLAGLKGKRIAIGPPGSGTRVLADTLLAANGVDGGNTDLRAIGNDEAARALRSGDIDAAFYVAARPTETLQQLVRDPAIGVMSFARAEAYQRLYRYLSGVVIPEGVLALEANVPSHDLTLVAPTAALVARRDIHPALVDLILGAATEVHRPGGLFTEAGRFPSPDHVDFPLAEDAERYFRSGPTFLRRVLPFWAAVLVERLLIMLVPLITVMIPLFKLAPPAYRWGVRRRIYRWYKELREIEEKSSALPDAATRADLVRRLDELQEQVGHLKIPLSYAENLYHLRLHIAFLRRHIEGGALKALSSASPDDTAAEPQS